MILKIHKISASTFFAIIPIYYFNSCTSVFLKQFDFFLPMVIASCFLWFMIIFAERRLNKLYKSESLIILGIYLFLLLLLVICGLQNKISVLSSNFTNALYILFFGIVFISYANKENRYNRLLIVTFWIIDTSLSCIYSIYRLIENPMLARLLATGSYHKTIEATSARGVVSYGVVYALSLVIVVFLFLLITKKEKRVLTVALITIFVALIIFAQFTISILMIFLGLLLIISTNNMSAKNMSLRVTIIIMVSIPVIVLFPYVLEFLVENNVFRYEITARIQEMLMFVSGGAMKGTDMFARFSQYTSSIVAFFTSFGLGKVWFPSIVVGTHSELLDGLANYGVIYVVFIIAFIRLYKGILNKFENPKSKYIYCIVGLIYLVISIVNTSLWAPITLSFFVIIPFICLNELDGEKSYNDIDINTSV